MYNKVILTGHLGKDPEIKHLESGIAVAKFSLATSESYKDKSGEWQNLTEWHDIVAWKNLAEKVERDFKKGSLVFVEGKITTRKWQDKEGNNRYSTEIVANVLRSLDKRESSGGDFKAFPKASDELPVGRQFQAPSGDQNQDQGSGLDIDDDLPF